MKRRSMAWIALGLSISLLAGCGTEKTTSGVKNAAAVTDADGKQMTVSEVSRADVLMQIQERYAGQKEYEYADPMYNLEEDHIFTFPMGKEFLEKASERFDENEIPVRVFSDRNLKQEVLLNWKYDEENMQLVVASDPRRAFNYDKERELDDSWGDDDKTDDVYEKYSEGSSWGSRSKFWMVQYFDFDTGEKLKQPIVTVFSIARKLNTPTLKQKVGKNGYYTLSWSEVEGADHYEVYELDSDMESATLQCTTEETSCTVNDFESEKQFLDEEEQEENDGKVSMMNIMLPDEESRSFFVVAKSKDGDCSGMSNECKPVEIANQIPRNMKSSFETEYEGESVLELPAFAEVEMLDGSVAKFLLDYSNAEAEEYAGDSVLLRVPFQNLDLIMFDLVLDGIGESAYKEQEEELEQRQKELETKSARPEEEIDIPYVPDNTEEPEKEEPEKEEPEKEEPEKEEPEKEEPEKEEPEKEEPEKEEPEKEEPEKEEPEKEEPEKEEPEKKTTTEPAGLDVASNVSDTLYANTALSEWIAWNLLAHEEQIALNDFPEASDSEYLSDAFLEAYNQNPLCGILENLSYDYEKNCLNVSYIQNAEETKKMQQDSLQKASEIADEIIKDGMSDYEKELAINQYLCEHASYNKEIMDYISEAGTIDEEAVKKFSNSFTPYGILVENLGVCESYSEAFQLVARAAGLDSIIVTGQLDGVNHEWNRVKLDESWYTLDVTNNDNEVISNALFNLSDDTAKEILLQSTDALMDEFIGNYTASDMDHEYYTMSGLYTEDADEAAKKLAEALDADGKAAVRMDSSLGGESVDTIVQKSVDQSGVDSARYYQFANVIVLTKE